MDSIWIDYYSILQVHYNAEPEVITGAYRLLSKKYHPDVNKTLKAEEMMKRLNIAYGVLSDARKRASYNVEWMRRFGGINAYRQAGAATYAATTTGASSYARTDAHTNSHNGAQANARTTTHADARTTSNASARANTRADARSTARSTAHSNTRATARADDVASLNIAKAKEQVANYYNHIKNNEYDSAYDCISAYDKTRIKRSDFCKWRETVGKIYELRACTIEYFKTHKFMRADKKIFAEAIEFTVSICERDISQNRFSDYKTSKIAVFEDAAKRSGGIGGSKNVGVYLGYADIKPFITAFGRGDKTSIDAKAMLDHWLRDQAIHDQLTGMYNYNGFLDAAKYEVFRNSRHNSVFSLVLFDVRQKTIAGVAMQKQSADASTQTQSSDASAQTQSADASNQTKSAASATQSATATHSADAATHSATATQTQPPDASVQTHSPGDDIAALTGQFLTSTLRAIDIPCRWKGGKFIALLAETDTEAAIRAANRICRDFNVLQQSQANAPDQYYAMYAGVSEYDSHSIASTLKKCSVNLALAKLGGRRAVKGVFTRLRTLKIANHHAR
ncbi:MAG: DnaJ domain-containing protein [Oscillospiraceae bacterium]|nr:DnaJ domain-containing protein [Oscillospiraceae bacterium]